MDGDVLTDRGRRGGGRGIKGEELVRGRFMFIIIISIIIYKSKKKK